VAARLPCAAAYEPGPPGGPGEMPSGSTKRCPFTDTSEVQVEPLNQRWSYRPSGSGNHPAGYCWSVTVEQGTRSTVSPMADNLQMYVDGAWVDARSGQRFDTTDPATGEVIATVPRGAADDVEVAAVAAARRTFDDGTWGAAVAERERAGSCCGCRRWSPSDVDELAELEVRDCGKPIADARADIDEVAFMFEYYGGWATKISGDIPPVGPDAMSLVVKEPVGCAV
jgi:hypothetical protein